MKRLLTTVAVGLVLCASAAAQDEAEFRFFSRGECRHFELRLPERCHSTRRSAVLARLGERSPQVYLAYPGQIKPYGPASYFAGMYTGQGACEIAVQLTRYGEEGVTQEQLLARAKFPAAPPEMPREAWNRYVAAQAEECEHVLRRDPHATFPQFVRLLASRRADVPLLEPGVVQPRWMRMARRPADLYSITTGALAVQETLQLEQMAEPYRAAGEKREHPVGALEGVRVPTHPFEKMLEGRRPVLSEISAAVPNDFYYCRFRRLDDLLCMFDFMEQWGNHFLRTYAVCARDDHLADKYVGQMLLDTGPVTRELFRQVIGEMAVVGSDPFFRSGTDVTIIIRTARQAALEAYMGRKVRAAARLRPDLDEETLDWLGVTLRVARTPDGAVSSIYGHADGFAVIGNSLPAVKRVVSALRGETPSLDEALDFRYIRTIYPSDAAEEDGFIYMSEAFLRNIIGPRLKIKEQRRIRCAGALRMVEHAALLFELEQRRRPRSMSKLEDSGYLPELSLVCPDGGQYSFDPQHRAAVCGVHNRLPHLTPHVETAVELVTTRERRDYNAFAWRYDSHWRTYFDPIAVRIGLGTPMTFETQILPLVDNTTYNQFRQWIGGEGIGLSGPDVLPGTVLAFGTRANLRAMLGDGKLAHAADARLGGDTVEALTRAFEPAVFLMIQDGEPLYRFDFTDYAGEVLRWRMEGGLVALPALAGLQLPTYAALKIKDQGAFEQFLSGVHSYVADRAAEKQFGRFAVHVDLAELPPRRDVRIYQVGVRLFAFEARCFYAAVGEYFYVANRMELLQRLIDAHAEGDGEGRPAAVGNCMIRFLPGNWQQGRRDMALAWEARSRQACYGNFPSIRPLLGVISDGAPLSDVSEGGGRRTYFCPDGGAYSLSQGRASCSVHGHPDAPLQPDAPRESSRMAALLDSCQEVAATFSFTEHGVSTKVCVTVSGAGAAQTHGIPATERQWAERLTEPGLPNLHRLTKDLYRGAQPTAEGMRRLEEMGVKTVLNLRSFHSDRDELAGTALAYEHIHVSALRINDREVVRFLKIVADADRAPVFVQCQHGADRTGLMCAVYRVAVCGWTKQEAIREMLDGGFGFHKIHLHLVDYLKELDIEEMKLFCFRRNWTLGLCT